MSQFFQRKCLSFSSVTGIVEIIRRRDATSKEYLDYCTNYAESVDCTINYAVRAHILVIKWFNDIARKSIAVESVAYYE